MSEEINTAASSEEAAVEKVVENTTDKKSKSGKLLKGVFLLSPTGRFGLAYNPGEKASLPELQALELDEAGYFKIDR